MQQSRRATPHPPGWEISAACAIAALTMLALAAHLARAVANLLATGRWTWPQQDQLVTALPGILAGDAGAGLPPGAVANTSLLYGCLVVVELLAVTAITAAVVAGLRRWGPSRVRGVATRDEAENLLGLRRLRRVAPVIRPDLHARQP
ncbi:hypothetical protein [Phycicoccus sp.]|uniref:hypothetical protein n=1 Tax=Phycicoccus sp. TaxID=1902410 RepID=UPI002B8CE6F3|nr:hypothetical protein [Phycicoccus sp.]HMM94026.1 hypothetical protein [Phycicoccus sp.]